MAIREATEQFLSKYEANLHFEEEEVAVLVKMAKALPAGVKLKPFEAEGAVKFMKESPHTRFILQSLMHEIWELAERMRQAQWNLEMAIDKMPKHSSAGAQSREKDMFLARIAHENAVGIKQITLHSPLEKDPVRALCADISHSNHPRRSALMHPAEEAGHAYMEAFKAFKEVEHLHGLVLTIIDSQLGCH